MRVETDMLAEAVATWSIEGDASRALAILVETIRHQVDASSVTLMQVQGERLVSVDGIGPHVKERVLREVDLTPDRGAFRLAVGSWIEGALILRGVSPDQLRSAESSLRPSLALAALLLRNYRLEHELFSQHAEADSGAVAPGAFQALYELATVARGAAGPAEVARVAVDRIRDLLGIHHAAVYWWDADSQLLHALADNDPRETGNEDRSLASGQGTIGLAFAQSAPVVVDDFFNWPGATPRGIERGIRSAAAMPLVVGDRTVGVLVARTYTLHTFTEGEIALLTLMAAGVAPTLELTRLYTESQQLNDELERRVEQRTAELQASYRELESFSYSVSHDLRAPLRGIDGFSLAVLEDYGDKLDAQGRLYLERLRLATQRMGRLIDAILSLSRVARSDVRRELVDLAPVAASVLGELRRADPGREVDLVTPASMVTRADPDLIRLALQNLIGNAWKFTGEQATAVIEVGSQSEDGEQIYFVRDNGAGFDMEYVDRMFRPLQLAHK